MQARYDLRSQGFYVAVIRARSIGVHEKIHFKPLPLNPSEDLLKPCLNAAAVQATEDVQNPNFPHMVAFKNSWCVLPHVENDTGNSANAP